MNEKKTNRKVILFGVDGATWTLFNQFIADGDLPNFERVVKSGAHGTLMSTVPAVTVPSWTSMFTGCNPGKHGITDFILNIDGKFSFGTSNFRRVETIWQMIGKNNMKSIVVNEPATFPADKINGIMTTGLMTPPGSTYVHPPELKSELERVAGGYWTDLPLDYYLTVNKDDAKAYSMIEEFANKTSKVGLHLARNYEWDALAVIFVSTDKIQHTLWHKPEYIRKHYIQMDGLLKEYLDLAAREDANVLITSDHGFGPLRQTFYINSWLAHIGLQKRKTNFVALATKLGITPTRLAMLLKKLHLYDYVLRSLIKSDIIVDAAFQYDRPIDMEKSIAFSKAEGIFINRQVVGDNYEKAREEIMTKLEKVIDQSNNNSPVVMKVHRREDVMSGAYIERAPDIMFTLHDGYCPTYYSDGPNSEYIGDDKGGYKGGTANTGIHRPEGIFMSYGPDIRSQQLAIPRTVWDIAPTILHMMNVSIPSYMDGVVMKEIFTGSSTMAAREIRKTGYEASRIKNKLKSLKKDT
ncbi:MAG TPA: alkaline phosphatase family protein [Nitrososphaera sp.]|nr:alkaline phosphatase family protein [Nitrososphaera sp.]